MIVLDEDDEPFSYYVQPATGKPAAERQRVQKTLFQEKQTIIENCLFGVDINPNSVKICRLRLWIELLKNAYYTDESGFAELETLPNIDINIKQGNSLLSKFSLTEDLSDVFRKQKFSLNAYKDAVRAYKDARSKDAKAELSRFISEIKSQFRETVNNRDPRRKKLADLRGKRALLDVNIDLFGNTIKDAKLVEVEKKRHDKLIDQVEAEIADVESNALYRGSFEWRFEFPEVLDASGTFVGFDAVIGNPPYIRQEELGESKKLLKADFPKTYAGTADLYVMFVEQGMRLLRPNGHFVYIIPNKWLRAGYGENLRKWLKTLAVEQIADFGDLPVFEEATTYPSILSIHNAPATKTINSVSIDTLTYPDGLAAYIDGAVFEITTDTLQDEGWQLTNVGVQQLMAKLRAAGKSLSNYIENKAYYGIKTGLTNTFVIDEDTKNKIITEDERSADVIRPFVLGRDVKPFGIPDVKNFLVLFEKGITNKKKGNDSAEDWLKKNYSGVYNHLLPYKEKAIKRTDKGDYWWELRACDYYIEFDKPKIMYQKFQVRPAFVYDESGLYCNDSMWIIAKEDKPLLALLNSSMGWFLISQYCTAIQNGYQLIFQYFGQIPIPVKIGDSEEFLTKKVDQILTAKAADPTADTSALEADIDRMVYALYGLTEAEIAIVEGR